MTQTNKARVSYGVQNGGICMKSHTEKHKVKLNPCKYCGETEVEIIYNRFNNQDHCVAQCKCGAYVQSTISTRT